MHFYFDVSSPWLAAQSLLVGSAGGGSLAAKIGYWTITNGWSNSKAVAGVTGILEVHRYKYRYKDRRRYKYRYKDRRIPMFLDTAIYIQM